MDSTPFFVFGAGCAIFLLEYMQFLIINICYIEAKNNYKINTITIKYFLKFKDNPMKGSSMIRVENDTLVIIRASYCKAFGSQCAAALVNLYSFWHDVNLAKYEQQKEFNKVARQHGEQIKRGYGLLQGHKQADLVTQLQGLFTKHDIVAANKKLVEIGVITIHKNPNKGYNFDRTNYFLFHPKVANSILSSIHNGTVHCPDTDNGETTDGQWSSRIRTSNSNRENLIENIVDVCAHEKIFELQNETKKEKEKSSAKKEKEETPPEPIVLNANAPRTYKSHIDIYETLVKFWKLNPDYAETIKSMIDPLGIQGINKKKAFFEYVKEIFCTSIKLNKKEVLSAFDLHDLIVQKIVYNKDEIRNLKTGGDKEEEKERKIATIVNKPMFNEEQEMLIVLYCQEKTGYKSLATSYDCRTHQETRVQNLARQASANFDSTKKYLIEKKLI